MSVSPGLRFAGLVALVLLVHALALNWFARTLDAAPLLRPMVAPMFTRQLQPQQPVAPPPMAAIRAAPTQPRRSVIAAAAPPAAPASAAQAPEAAASAAVPSEPPQTQAALPAAPASAASQPEAPLPMAAASAATASLDSWPADTRLNYRLSGNYRGDLHGSARVQWQRQAEKYQARVEIDLTLFMVTLTSQGEVTPQGLLPNAYEERQPNRARGVRLGEQSVTLHDGRNLPRPPRAQDTASQFVELSHRFSTGEERLEVGRAINIWLARPGGVDLWTYDIVALETLQTPQLGAVPAFHLKPRPLANPRGNITAEMWFAPSLQYLPVRIRVNMGTDIFVDLMVDKIEQR